MTTAGPCRAGFALPTVIILSMVVAVVSAVMLERASVQRLTVHRQVQSYRGHHLGRGLREVLGQWSISLSGQPIERMIAPDGRILDLYLSDGLRVGVYLEDGQGSVHSVPSQFAGQERVDAQIVLDELMERTQGRPDPSWLRSVGPAKICAATAPAEVLEAVASGIMGNPAGSKGFARVILDARRRGTLTSADLASAASRANMTAEERARLDRLLSAGPELWRLTAEVTRGEGRQQEVVGRFRGYLSLGAQGFGASAFGSLQSLGAFLSWEELPIDYDEGTDSERK